MESKHSAENIELDLLLDRGVEFEVSKRGLFTRFSKKKKRKFSIKQPYLGTLDVLSSLYLGMDMSEVEIDKDPHGESKRLVNRSAKKCAMVVAVAVLNSKWGIKFFAKPFAKYLMWRVTPKMMWQLALTINNMSNLGDFTNSIRLMSGARTTAPIVENLMEDQSKLD